MTVCWLCWARMVPMPVASAPDRASASICQAPDPLRPPDWYGFQLVPFAELSTDGGATWQQVPFGSPGPYTSFTALTANGAGFTAAGLFGQPGHQDVALWASTNGASWRPYQSGGLNGSGAWQIDALARSGAEVTGIGTILAQQSQQTVTFTLPPR